jgi:PhoPQ-activated pathogenicity-related protein
MLPAEMIFFAVTLFLALAALIQWKLRRFVAAGRLKRGLAGYVAARRKRPVRAAVTEETEEESLIPV